MRIRLEHLEKGFDGVPVLRGIDFDDDVTTLAVIGPSGGGKSTLLRIVGGLIAPTGGTVEVDGERVDYDERALPSYRSQLGFVFQASGLFHHLSALENVALPLSVVHGVPEDQARERAADLLARFGLAAEEAKRPAQLSGGQQQRVAIARALITKPQLVFADEPTGNLDSISSAEVLSFLKRSVNELGQTIIMVTHDPVAASYADRAIVFADGRIVADVDDPTADQMSDLLMKERELSTRNASNARHAG